MTDTDEGRKAVAAALEYYRGITASLRGTPTADLLSSRVEAGFGGFARCVAADAFVNLHRVLHPLLGGIAEAAEAIGEHAVVRLPGIAFTDVARAVLDGQTSLTATVGGTEGRPDFLIAWNSTDDTHYDMEFRTAPTDDRPWLSEFIAAAGISVDDRGHTAEATVWLSGWPRFLDAVETLRPLEHAIAALPADPGYLRLGVSLHRLKTTAVAPLVASDGGLPGLHCAQVGQAIADDLSTMAVRHAAVVNRELGERLLDLGLEWGSGFLLFNDGDDYVCAVRRETDDTVGVVHTNVGGELDTSLVFTDRDADGKALSTSIFVMERGELAAIEAFRAGNPVEGLAVVRDHLTKSAPLGRAQIEAHIIQEVPSAGAYALAAIKHLSPGATPDETEDSDAEAVHDFSRFEQLHQIEEDTPKARAAPSL